MKNVGKRKPTSSYYNFRKNLRKLFVLLYADDTVIMAESREDLQAQLNVFGEYCKKWKLKVNAEKTNIFIFFLEVNFF
jgi:hypothetical protein